jgi:hypothetical protein
MRVSALLLYTVWNVWRECNRRVFDGTSSSPARVFALIKEELQLQASLPMRELTSFLMLHFVCVFELTKFYVMSTL